MNKRLIWKEWREKRWWGLVFFAFVAAELALFQDGLSYGGHVQTISPWVFLLALPGLLLGLTTFSRETGYECQDFIFSRPIGWKRVLGAKLLIDCGLVLAGILAGGFLYRLLLPSAYAPFFSIWQLLSGVGLAFAVTMMGYLPGFGASVVLPGMLGGGVVLLLVGCAALVEFMVGVEYFDESDWKGLVGAWVLAVIITTVMMAKRGLGLSAKERARKYGIYVVVISTLMLCWTVPLANHLARQPADLGQDAAMRVTDVSPDGRFVIAERTTSTRRPLAAGEVITQNSDVFLKDMFLVRRSDGATYKLAGDAPEFWPGMLYEWAAPDSLILLPRYFSGKQSNKLAKLRMDSSGRIIQREAALQPYKYSFSYGRVTTDGHLAFILESVYSGVPPGQSRGVKDKTPLFAGCGLDIVDLDSMKQIDTQYFPNEHLQPKWESNTVLDLFERSGQEGLDHSSHLQYILRINPRGSVSMETVK